MTESYERIADEAPLLTGGLKSASGRGLSPRWLQIVATIWAGQAFSIVTSGAAGWAVIWHVTQTTQSALALSLVMVCSLLPQGVLAPLGGALADRVNRKTLIIAADLGAGTASLALAAIIASGETSLTLICMFAAVRSAFSAFHSPAMMAAMPMLVPERHLLRINTLDQVLTSLANVCAPAIGIGLYSAFGLSFALVLEFGGAVAAVAAMMLVKIPTVREQEKTSVLQQMADGWQVLAAERGLVLLLGGLTVGLMAFASVSAVYPLMSTQYFGADGAMVSIAEAVSGLCMLVGAGIIMVWGGGRRLALLLCASAVLVALPTIAAGLLPRDAFWVYVALMGVASVFMAWFNGPVMTLIQRYVPEEKTGRALGFFYAAIGIAMPAGVAIGGALAESIGVAPFFVVSGALFALIGLAGYAVGDVRALDRVARQGAAQVRGSRG